MNTLCIYITEGFGEPRLLLLCQKPHLEPLFLGEEYIFVSRSSASIYLASISSLQGDFSLGIMLSREANTQQSETTLFLLMSMFS